MSQLAAACSTDLMEYLIDLLQPLLDEKGAVIWYDKDGALEHPLRASRESPGLDGGSAPWG